MRHSRNIDGELSGLIGDIYEAAITPSLWQGVVTRIAGVLGGSKGVLWTPGADAARMLWAAKDISPEQMQSYAEYYHQMDLWTIAGIERNVPVGQPGVDEMLVPSTTLAGSEYYNDFLKPLEIYRFCGVALEAGTQGPIPRTQLSILRTRREQPFDDVHMRLIAVLAPHLQRALRIHWLLAEREQQRAVDIAVLDQLTAGVILVAEDGRVLHLNRSARSIVAQNDGLKFAHGKIQSALADETARLARLIAQATLQHGDNRFAGGSAVISRPSGRSPFTLFVAPLPADPRFRYNTSHAAAAVFISNDELRAQSAAELLTSIYALTPAETRLAQAMMSGQSLKNIVGELGISLNTAHTQLNSIFAKTGTHRQAELVRLLLSIPVISTSR